jgi:hypothetical protein
VIQTAYFQVRYFYDIRNVLLTIAGDVPGMLDYMIWPWFERIDAFEIVAPEKFVLPTGRYSKLVN